LCGHQGQQLAARAAPRPLHSRLLAPFHPEAAINHLPYLAKTDRTARPLRSVASALVPSVPKTVEHRVLQRHDRQSECSTSSRQDLATVATKRWPSALAATDVYFSRPKLTRRVILRSASKAHSQGPEPSAACAT